MIQKVHPMTRLVVTLLLAAVAVLLAKLSNGFVSRMTQELVGDRGLEWSVYSSWYSAVWITLSLLIMGSLGVAAAFLWGRMAGPPRGLQLLSLGPTGLGRRRLALLTLSAGFPTYVSANLTIPSAARYGHSVLFQSREQHGRAGAFDRYGTGWRASH